MKKKLLTFVCVCSMLCMNLSSVTVSADDIANPIPIAANIALSGELPELNEAEEKLLSPIFETKPLPSIAIETETVFQNYVSDSPSINTLNEASANGDINDDGGLSVSDVVLLQKWLLGVSDIHLTNWKNADFSEDDKLDIKDLSLMKRALLEELNIDPSIDESEIPMVFWGYYDETNNDVMSSEKLALKSKSFCALGETLKVDAAMGNLSPDADTSWHYEYNIFACDPLNCKNIKDENLIVNGEYCEYRKVYPKEDWEIFDISGKEDDYDLYHHEIDEIDFSNYETDSSGCLEFFFAWIYDGDPLNPQHTGMIQLLYFYVGERGTAVSNRSVEEAKENYLAIVSNLDVDDAKDDFQAVSETLSNEQDYMCSADPINLICKNEDEKKYSHGSIKCCIPYN